VRNFAICGRAIPAYYPHSESIEAVSIDGVRVVCGVLETADREFDPARRDNAGKVLVRVRRFSCNYRDKSFVMRAVAQLPSNKFFVIGSEFVGEVVAVGSDVRRVRPGDRVIGDNSYPHVGPGDAPAAARGGIPTNGASGEYLVLHQDKVIGVPPAMPDEVAAAFSLGAQTAFSMVAKLSPEGGEHVLVTAATSNTSLCAIEALRRHDVNIYAVTTSERHAERLRARNVREVFVVNTALSLADHDALLATVRAVGGFTGVIDPFFDLYLLKVLPLMRNGGRYVSCGFHDQSGVTPAATNAPIPNYYAAVCCAIVRNIALMGNCIGQRHHLEQAVAAYEGGRFDVPIDSVFDNDRAGAFLTRTFAAPDRFGKVVYAYQ
jgi:NADPH:quinone reductase-like Zn-dependent oxidoreductase